jgi:hypothetical protein
MNAMQKIVLTITATIIVAADAHAGRWLSRDPIQDGAGFVQRDLLPNEPNLYAFVANNSINSIDAFGLWQIQRNGGERALAIPDSGDTVTKLAQMYRLDDKDFTIWLKPVDNNSKMPKSANETIECGKFIVPNTIYIEFGETTLMDDLFGPIPSWRRSLKLVASQSKSDGFNVILTDPSNASIARGHLQSDNIYGFAFAGHGAGGGQLRFNNGSVNDSLAPSRLTPYGIAFLFAYGCSTADQQSLDSRFPGLGARMGYEYSVWEKNVSTRGWFTGVYGIVNGYQAWSEILNANGTNTK